MSRTDLHSVRRRLYRARCCAEHRQARHGQGGVLPQHRCLWRRRFIYTTLAVGNQVKRIDGSGSVTTVVGTGTPRTTTANGDGGRATAATLNHPIAVTADVRGDLYVLDDQGARVRFINLGSTPVKANGVTVGPGAIDTVAGTGSPGLAGDGGRALRAQLAGQSYFGVGGGVAVAPDGTLFIADFANDRVRRVDPAGVITTFAGTGAPPPRDMCCQGPTSVAVDAGGNLLVAGGPRDPYTLINHPRVWFVNRGTRPATMVGVTVQPGAVMPIAGTGYRGLGDDGGQALHTDLGYPDGVAADRRGIVYITDVAAGAAAVGSVRRVDAAGVITTVVGDGLSSASGYTGQGSGGGFNGDGRIGRLTSVRTPIGVAVDRCGNVVFADQGNDRVRRLDLLGPCPAIPAAGPLAPEGAGGISRAWILAALLVAVGGGGLLVRGLRGHGSRGG